MCSWYFQYKQLEVNSVIQCSCPSYQTKLSPKRDDIKGSFNRLNTHYFKCYRPELPWISFYFGLFASFTMRSLKEEVQPQQGVHLCFTYALTKWRGYNFIRSLVVPGLGDCHPWSDIRCRNHLKRFGVWEHFSEARLGMKNGARRWERTLSVALSFLL